MLKPRNHKNRKVRVIAYNDSETDKRAARIAEQILNSPEVQSKVAILMHQYHKKILKEILDDYKSNAISAISELPIRDKSNKHEK